MSYPRLWNSETSIVDENDYNAIVKYFSKKGASFIIYKNGSYYEAISGTTGKLVYGGEDNAGDVDGTDAAAVIQAVIEEEGSSYIKNGIYPLSNALVFDDYETLLVGEHPSKTILRRAGDVAYMRNSTSPVLSHKQGINNIMIDGVDKSGIGLTLKCIHRCLFGNVKIVKCNTGLDIISCLGNNFINPLIGEPDEVGGCNTSVKFENDLDTGIVCNSNVFFGGELNNGNPNVHIYGGAGGNKFVGVIIEGAQQTQILFESVGGYVPRMNRFLLCTFESTHETAIHINDLLSGGATIYPSENTFWGCKFTGISGYTIANFNGNRNRFIANDIDVATWHGTVTLNITGDDNIITDNIRDIATDAVIVINNSGARNKIKNNEGYVTENSGTATITDSTTVEFEHGLTGTPTHVNISFKDTGYGSWIWSADETNITITVAVSGTYDLTWDAEYKP